MENNLITTEELFKKYRDLYNFEEGEPEYLIDIDNFKNALIEFAKLHVKAALEQASENAKLVDRQEYIGFDIGWTYIKEIDKNSILNCYPEENIK